MSAIYDFARIAGVSAKTVSRVSLLPLGGRGRLVLVNAFDDAGTACVLPDAGVPYDPALVRDADRQGAPEETPHPQLTTMELPYGRMGETAGRLMLGELSGEAPLGAGVRVEVRGALRWRDSVRPGPARRDHNE